MSRVNSDGSVSRMAAFWSGVGLIAIPITGSLVPLLLVIIVFMAHEMVKAGR